MNGLIIPLENMSNQKSHNSNSGNFGVHITGANGTQISSNRVGMGVTGRKRITERESNASPMSPTGRYLNRPNFIGDSHSPFRDNMDEQSFATRDRFIKNKRIIKMKEDSQY
jgi:hypothetical protein